MRFFKLTDGGYLAAKKPPDDHGGEINIHEYCAAKHPDLYSYDIETYFNVFTVTITYMATGHKTRFKIIDGVVNEGVALFQFLTALRDFGARMVGFNNIGFDYIVLHELIGAGGHVSAHEMWQMKNKIFNCQDRFGITVWPSDWYVKQVDLYKINHFDNQARSTSLKMLENNMRSDNIQDLPFDPDLMLDEANVPVLVQYNDHDVDETGKFLGESINMLEFRDELTEKYGKDFTNHNDTKIGKDYFIMKLEEAGFPCYIKERGKGKKPVQTVREIIDLGQAVLPHISFRRPEFQNVVNWLRSQKIRETKGVFDGLCAVVDGLQYDFGTGGIHASIDPCTVTSDDTHQVIDLDVASYYPNLAIANNFYPEHMGSTFCDIYKDVYEMRKGYAKGTAENAMLKLALNGVYGDSNNQYSPFYDPLYTMKITINGQLLLCMLAEWLTDAIPGLMMIQANTDGITVKCPRIAIDQLNFIAKTWEDFTGLELEAADYSRMMIRDVNNYIAEYEGGKLKRKGAYCYGEDLGWHQNHGSQVIARAAEAHLVRGVDIEKFIRCHADKYDFMLRTKVPRSSRLEIHHADGTGKVLQNITRYYISSDPHRGGALKKIMPPTPKQVEKNRDAPERVIGISVGWNVEVANNIHEYGSGSINYDYYIQEAMKLVTPIKSGGIK